MKSAEWEGRGRIGGRDKTIKVFVIKCRKTVWVNEALDTNCSRLLFSSMSACAHTRKI